MIARFPTTKWYLCTNGATVFHFGRVEAGQQLSTGQADTEIFDTEEALNTRLAELGQDAAMLVPPSPALTPEQINEARKEREWKRLDDYLANAFDRNARERATLWLMDPACPQWRKERIMAVLMWMDAAWAIYAPIRERILAGEDVRLDLTLVGTSPFSFWDLAAE